MGNLKAFHKNWMNSIYLKKSLVTDSTEDMAGVAPHAQ